MAYLQTALFKALFSMHPTPPSCSHSVWLDTGLSFPLPRFKHLMVNLVAHRELSQIF
jgi:hypothetical protein